MTDAEVAAHMRAMGHSAEAAYVVTGAYTVHRVDRESFKLWRDRFPAQARELADRMSRGFRRAKRG